MGGWAYSEMWDRLLLHTEGSRWKRFGQQIRNPPVHLPLKRFTGTVTGERPKRQHRTQMKDLISREELEVAGDVSVYSSCSYCDPEMN